MQQCTGDLTAMRSHVARVLNWPDNLGIQMLDLKVGTARGLLIWIDGFATEEAIAREILGPLSDYCGEPKLTCVAQVIRIPRRREEPVIDRMLEAVLSGGCALLLDGEAKALLLDTLSFQYRFAEEPSPGPIRMAFGTELRLNIALIRRRLQDARLRALPVRLRRPERGQVAMLYLEGRAWPPLVRQVRRWAWRHMGEEGVARGLPAGGPAVFGALPRFASTRSPDEAAQLLDVGCVLLLTNQFSTALVAPVIAPMWVLAPSDRGERYPARRWLVLLRLFLHGLVLLLPAMLVGLLNYHVDMVPTSFLAAMASTRENAPFGTLFEVLMVEALTEVVRAVTFHAATGVTPGIGLVAEYLFLLLAVQTGFIGPLPALVGGLGALASQGLPTHDGAYAVRIWRFFLLLAAVNFGFFGMGAGLILMIAYLCRAKSWGVPFLGPSGFGFTAPESKATRPPGPKGGDVDEPQQAHIR